mmetsp:Transcript_411/g.780  ORF Transcript_411/g.780 Transcript_411/m.780 type:complete len:162 (-) Transcript_411:552-1037(-)
MPYRVPFFLSWSLLALKVEGFKKNDALPCFVVQHRGHHQRQRNVIVAAPLPLLMGIEDDNDNEMLMPNNISIIAPKPSSKNRIVRIHENNRMLYKSKIKCNEAATQQAKMKEAKLVEKFLFDADHKMSRNKVSETTISSTDARVQIIPIGALVQCSTRSVQ